MLFCSGNFRYFLINIYQMLPALSCDAEELHSHVDTLAILMGQYKLNKQYQEGHHSPVRD